MDETDFVLLDAEVLSCAKPIHVLMSRLRKTKEEIRLANQSREPWLDYVRKDWDIFCE